MEVILVRRPHGIRGAEDVVALLSLHEEVVTSRASKVQRPVRPSGVVVRGVLGADAAGGMLILDDHPIRAIGAFAVSGAS
ncbi:hypothetical protein ACWGQ5_41795 [Streptomyces sp. NPDC055722]